MFWEIGKVVENVTENDLSVSIVFVNYHLKYQCKTFYFTICRAIKKDTLLFESLLE